MNLSKNEIERESGNLAKNKTALTDLQIKAFCKKHNLPYHIIDLKDLDKNDYDCTFVYTGNEANEFNGGNPHHYCFLVGSHFFDSYGKHNTTDEGNAYKLPEHIKIFDQKPNRIQSYDTNVCGEYCCLFYQFLNENGELAESDLAQAFITYYNFSTNRTQNDETCLAEFKKEAAE